MSQSEKNPSFEASLEELEALGERMEDGELSLEDSLKTFERGMALAKSCQTALDKAEQRVEQLSEEDDSESSTDDDDESEDEA